MKSDAQKIMGSTMDAVTPAEPNPRRGQDLAEQTSLNSLPPAESAKDIDRISCARRRTPATAFKEAFSRALFDFFRHARKNARARREFWIT